MKLLVLCVLVFSEMAWVGADPVPNDGSADEDPMDLVQRSASCSSGWSEYNGNCYHYVSMPLDWASAEKHCMSMGGHLASVHNLREYHQIQNVIRMATYGSGLTWVGGSNAQKTSIWLWSDGSQFHYTNWCRGQPNNLGRGQHCLEINLDAAKCWNDRQCGERRPSVCAKKA
ncbi:galactose-specific lectin nattectin-like isoform X2 [Cyprinodon tularosa]|uniref:galactose-specific lectin nattectin-like isoform X2 n=1 Tax=Cyprinodon tularosa TaxID=77115 RepID=UPI0018E241D9|nr:galactose-specific lectin nattectin-like isoform X2 [Cyprinodon tularosa]